MANIGWIKLHRSILDWEWYEDKNTTRLLIHLLASVNHEDKKWKGNTIKAGSMAFSWDTLSLKCGLSKQQLRTSMGKLESSNEVTRSLTGKYQLVSLCKWGELQGVNSKVTAKPTDNQQKNNSKVTPTKEEKKLKKERREKDFNFFWSLYPNKVSKSKCLEKFMKLNQNDVDLIMSTIRNYVSFKPFKDYTHPNPLTYLNQKRWEDEIKGSKIETPNPDNEKIITFYSNIDRTKKKLPESKFLALQKAMKDGGYIYTIVD